MALCENGHDNEASVAFCTTCGLALVAPPSPTPSGSPVSQRLPLPGTPAGATVAATPQRRRGPLIAMLLGAGVVVALILTFAVVVPGMNRTTVPSLTGMTSEAAKAALEKQGLALGATQRTTDNDVPVDGIINQEPSAGAEVSKGTTVSIVVSDGPDLRTFTYVADQSNSIIDLDLDFRCDTYLTLFTAYYGSAEIWDRAGKVLSRIKGSWEPEPDNGEWLPCKTRAVFPDIPANAGEFRVVLDPEEAEGNYVGWWTPEELDALNWTAEK